MLPWHAEGAKYQRLIVFVDSKLISAYLSFACFCLLPPCASSRYIRLNRTLKREEAAKMRWRSDAIPLGSCILACFCLCPIYSSHICSAVEMSGSVITRKNQGKLLAAFSHPYTCQHHRSLPILYRSSYNPSTPVPHTPHVISISRPHSRPDILGLVFLQSPPSGRFPQPTIIGRFS